MGICTSKPSPYPDFSSPKSQPALSPNNQAVLAADIANCNDQAKEESNCGQLETSKKFPFYSPNPTHYFLSKRSPVKSPPANVSVNSSPKRFFKPPFPPPSPAKHIRAALALRRGTVKPNKESTIQPVGNEEDQGTELDKSSGRRLEEDILGEGHP